MSGLARLAIVAFKTERVFDYVPEAVMLGFATGAALIIGLMQIDEFLGVPFAGVQNVIDEVGRGGVVAGGDQRLRDGAIAAGGLPHRAIEALHGKQRTDRFRRCRIELVVGAPARKVSGPPR